MTTDLQKCVQFCHDHAAEAQLAFEHLTLVALGARRSPRPALCHLPGAGTPCPQQHGGGSRQPQPAGEPAAERVCLLASALLLLRCRRAGRAAGPHALLPVHPAQLPPAEPCAPGRRQPGAPGAAGARPHPAARPGRGPLLRPGAAGGPRDGQQQVRGRWVGRWGECEMGQAGCAEAAHPLPPFLSPLSAAACSTTCSGWSWRWGASSAAATR